MIDFCEYPYGLTRPQETPMSLNSELKEMVYSPGSERSELLADVMCKNWNIKIYSNGVCPNVRISIPAELEFYLRKAEIFEYGKGRKSIESVRQTIESIIKRQVYIYEHSYEFTRSSVSFVYSYNESNDYLGFRNSTIHPETLTHYRQWTTEEILFKACELIYTITGNGTSSCRLECLHDFDTYIINNEQHVLPDPINKEEFFMLLNGELNFEEEVVEQ